MTVTMMMFKIYDVVVDVIDIHFIAVHVIVVHVAAVLLLAIVMMINYIIIPIAAYIILFP
jgi:hypothetical protein